MDINNKEVLLIYQVGEPLPVSLQVHGSHLQQHALRGVMMPSGTPHLRPASQWHPSWEHALQHATRRTLSLPAFLSSLSFVLDNK